MNPHDDSKSTPPEDLDNGPSGSAGEPPSRKEALEIYKQIIDQLVEYTSSIGARQIREGNRSRIGGSEEFAAFVNSCDGETSRMIADIADQERRGGIHDVLAHLTWWLSCRHVSLSYRGIPMPVDLSGMGLHGDYIGRLTEWEWPDDDEL